VQPVPFTIKVVSLNPVHDEVYSIQHSMIKFVSDLQQVSGFLHVLRFPPPIKLTATRNIVESGVKHHNPNLNNNYILILPSNHSVLITCIVGREAKRTFRNYYYR